LPLSLEMSLFLCALAPFGAALAAPLLQPVFERWNALLLALVPALITLYLGSFIAPIAAGQTFAVSVDWIPAYGMTLSFLLDGLSLTFALLISGIGTLILIYSGSYLKNHPHQGRFLSFMLLFMGAMLGLVLADNMIALYGFWELTTVTSFLLIGFDHTRQAARRAAIQALVVTNIGGLALLAGFIVLQQAFGSWELSGLRAIGAAVPAHELIGFVLVAILLAAFTKSAQAPFHFWLVGAMQAPTPVSAYLHSATMVQAGIYLLARMFPLLGETPGWSETLVPIGTITLLWGALSALRQTDLKLMLAQSTVAALGLLVILLGIGTEAAVTAAVLYFVAHALY
jgi:multicomponent Na+:H+ antiporter subunit A